MNDNLYDIENDIDKMFNLLKVPNQEKDEIDHSTLMALLLYSDVDKEEPEFFSYLKKTLEGLEKKHSQTNSNISKQEFVRIFTEPDISYQNLKIDEMASLFKIFDKDKRGSFSADDFLHFYRQSQEFKNKPHNEQENIENRIRKDFEAISDSKEITPIEFYKILNALNL